VLPKVSSYYPVFFFFFRFSVRLCPFTISLFSDTGYKMQLSQGREPPFFYIVFSVSFSPATVKNERFATPPTLSFFTISKFIDGGQALVHTT